MSKMKNQFWQKIGRIASFGTIVQFASANWAQVVLIGGIGISFGWSGRLSAILAPYAPLGWLVAAIAGVLAGQLILLAYRKGQKIAIDRAYVQKLTNVPTRINPMKDVFEREVISLSDFQRPGPLVWENKTFRDCEFHGPGNLFFGLNAMLNGCQIDTNNLLVNQGNEIGCAIAFKDSSLINCRFLQIGLIVPQEIADQIRANRPGSTFTIASTGPRPAG